MTQEQKDRFAELKRKFKLRPLGSRLPDDERAELKEFHQIQRREDVETYGNRIDWMTALLYKHDPIRLVKCEVPIDEYESEGIMILRRGIENRSVEEIQQIVWEVFDHQFSLSEGGYYHSEAGKATDPVYRNIALEISQGMETKNGG